MTGPFSDYVVPAKPATPARRVSLTPLSKVVMRVVLWLWQTGVEGHGRIPLGSLVIAAGRAGIGKSQFAVWLAANVTRGTLPGALSGQPRNVIYAAAEDSFEMTIVPRLFAAGADLDRVFRVEVATSSDHSTALTLPTDTSQLAGLIAAHEVALVVLDPLLSSIDAGVNDYRAREVRAALEPLVAAADDTRCTVFGIAHFTKASGTDPLLLIGGSAGFGQLVRAALGFARDEESGECVLSTIKNNLGREDLPSLGYTIVPKTVETPEGPSEVSRLVLGDESNRHVRDLLRDRDGDNDRNDRDEAVEWLAGYLSEHGGEASAKDVLRAGRADGIAERTLQRARERAGVTSARRGFGQGAVWSLDSFAPHSRHSRQPSDLGANGANGGANDGTADSDRTVVRLFPSRPERADTACGHPPNMTVEATGQCALCLTGGQS